MFTLFFLLLPPPRALTSVLHRAEGAPGNLCPVAPSSSKRMAGAVCPEFSALCGWWLGPPTPGRPRLNARTVCEEMRPKACEKS